MPQQIIFLILFLFICVYLTRNYLAVPTSIPGPFLARFTDFWRAYKQYNGQLRSELIQLHAKHGPIIRYGIRSISISEPEAIDIIYGSRAGFVTADSYNVLIGISNGKEVPSLVSTRDEARHAQLRRSVASSFTMTGAEDYEKFVDATVPDLLDAIHQKADGKVDLSDLFMLYSIDSAARQAFSESLGCLRSGCDIDGSIELIRDRFRHWGWWSSLPWLERLVYRNPWAMRRSIGKTPGAMVSTAAQKLKSRMSAEKEQDVDLLHKFIAASRANPEVFDAQAIISLLMSTISGAGDTTATTLTVIFFFLMKHPSELDRLRAELAGAGISKNETPSFKTTSKLPYLAAVIKESMRLYPVTTWPTERRVPAGGIVTAGKTIPQGSSVGIFIPALHLDKNTFGDDALEFRPQRWINSSESKLRTMEHAFMGFSRGRRVCLGQNVAMMQMKKVVPALIMTFDFKLVSDDAQLEADFSPAVAYLKPLCVTAEPARSKN